MIFIFLLTKDRSCDKVVRLAWVRLDGEGGGRDGGKVRLDYIEVRLGWKLG